MGEDAVMSLRPPFRVGHGFDVHRFSDDASRPLVLGGVTFAGERGLVGHSDADPVAHAICDAVLGAVGLGDIGTYFPDTDARWKDADSMTFVEESVKLAKENGYDITSIDVTVVCERPKLAQHREAIERKLSVACLAPVNIKAKRAEGLGAIGRVEGIAVFAVAMALRHDPPVNW